MNIKIATKKDIGKLLDVYSEWSKFKNILPSAMINLETFKDMEEHFNNSPSKRKYFLALNEGNPLGACYVDISFLRLRNIRIGDMLVKEKYRNQGVGIKLIEEVIKFAKKNKIKKIWLWTQEELEPAVEFYKKRGFILEARLIKHFCDKDTLQFGLVL